MILLTEIANKISNMLNGIDSETSTITGRPDFQFLVATSGFHLDKLADIKTGKNVIPVFIASSGGEYNPVPNLKQSTFTTSITIYFPVRFKDTFYNMNDFLADLFVGQIRNYGTITGKCLTNISIATFGEIQDIDLREFATWTESVFQTQIDTREPYLSMGFNLFLTNSASTYIYGNQVSYSLQYKANPYINITRSGTQKKYTRFPAQDGEKDGEKYYAFQNTSGTPILTTYYFTKTTTATSVPTAYYGRTINPQTFEPIFTLLGNTDDGIILTTYSDTLDWTQCGTGVSNSPIAQQLIDTDNYTRNTINITTYSKSILAYIKDNEFWREIIKAYNKQDMESLSEFKLTKTYDLATDLSYTYDQVILSMNENIARGELLSFTITFGDKI